MSIVRSARGLIALACLLAVAACGDLRSTYPDKQAGQTSSNDNGSSSSSVPDDLLFGDDGLFGPLFYRKGSEGGIGINAFLWRASLETLAFMPLSSADPFGGVIITDWYALPETPNERFKMTVYITDRDLHADAIRVSAFRQVKNANNEWVDATLAPKTTVDLENAILTRARELRAALAALKHS
jgi:hypothetical protein